MAGEQKQFDENSKLGFMRLIQVYNVLTIFGVSFVLIFVRGSEVKLDIGVLANVTMLISQAIVVWLIARRKIYTRQIVIGIELFEILVMLTRSYAEGNLSLESALFAIVPPGIVILYFLFSPRAKAVLVQPWNDTSVREQQEAKSRALWDPKSVEFWMRLLLYFFVFSIAGHWMEMGVQILVINGIMPGTIASPDSLTWRDNLNPFPIYGIAVVFCGLALYPAYLALRKRFSKHWQALLVSFLLNTLFCVVAELILGFLFNADYHAWDYRDQFLNFEGQVCLFYSLAFGVAASLITWFVYPMLESRIANLSRDAFRVFFVASVVLYLLIFITYNIDLADLGISLPAA